jgi:uncharacterized protein
MATDELRTKTSCTLGASDELLDAEKIGLGNMVFRFVRCAILALAATTSAGTAQDLQTGEAAYDAGDFATALREWLPLAEQGNASAQYNLGFMYDLGEGVPQDYAESMNWYRMAAAQGDAIAQNNLGLMYDLGNGVPQDGAEAVKWYRMAAVQSYAIAQYNLGNIYDLGDGVPRDYITAHMWYDIASSNGADDAGKNRDVLTAKMSPADVSEAQRRARVCMASTYKDCD